MLLDWIGRGKVFLGEGSIGEVPVQVLVEKDSKGYKASVYFKGSLVASEFLDSLEEARTWSETSVDSLSRSSISSSNFSIPQVSSIVGSSSSIRSLVSNSPSSIESKYTRGRDFWNRTTQETWEYPDGSSKSLRYNNVEPIVIQADEYGRPTWVRFYLGGDNWSDRLLEYDGPPGREAPEEGERSYMSSVSIPEVIKFSVIPTIKSSTSFDVSSKVDSSLFRKFG